MKILLLTIVILAQGVCMATLFSSCTTNESHYGSSTHVYYKKDLKKSVLSSSINKCSKLYK